VLQALDRHRVGYVLIGGLGRVIQGSAEITGGVDVVPSLRKENLRRLGLALDDLNARRPDGTRPEVQGGFAAAVLELETDAGEVKIVAEPAGTRGYDDLRRGASREPLGEGLRPLVASLGDHARMLAALDREQDQAPLRTLRRLIEPNKNCAAAPAAASTSDVRHAASQPLPTANFLTAIASERQMHPDAGVVLAGVSQAHERSSGLPYRLIHDWVNSWRALDSRSPDSMSVGSISGRFRE
jgi:hypothetical protein